MSKPIPLDGPTFEQHGDRPKDPEAETQESSQQGQHKSDPNPSIQRLASTSAQPKNRCQPYRGPPLQKPTSESADQQSREDPSALENIACSPRGLEFTPDVGPSRSQ
jgi:hypothetical protein